MHLYIKSLQNTAKMNQTLMKLNLGFIRKKYFSLHKNSCGYLLLRIVKIETLRGYLFLQICLTFAKFSKISNNKVY